MDRGLWKVPEWFFEKVNESCKNYGMLLCGEYKNNKLDHTILRVDSVVGETEKAYNVIVEAETFGGSYKPWKVWIPKSILNN